MATLGDYISIKHGYAFKGDGITTEDNGIVLVTPGNFAIGGGFKEGKCKFFNDVYPSEFVLSADDLIVTMTDLSKEMDTLGYSALVPESSRVYLHNQRIGLVSINREGLDKHYLYWFMRTRNYQRTIAGGASGTTVHHTSPSRICEVEVDFPDLITQKKIAGLMDAIEGKIQKNEEVNENLLQQASSIYQAWFEDFVLSDGSCPSIWGQGTLSDIANISSGKRPPVKSAEKTDTAVIPLVGAASVMGYTTDANHTDKILVTGRVGTHGVVQRFNSPCWTSDNTLVITSNFYEYTFQILQRIDYHAMNRGSTQPLITQGDMNKASILIPDKETLLNFETLVGQLMEQYEANLLENGKLAELRDTLLPRLMSGELDVSDLDL